MNEREIFEGALDYADPQQRRAYLDQACGNDAVLRGRVEALLDSHDSASQFLKVPAMEQIKSPNEDAPVQTSAFPPGSGHEGKYPTVEDGDDPPDLGFLKPSPKPGSIGSLGHYDILQLLGQGAFGLVFKAFDEKLHRLVAIKVMNPRLAATSPPRKRFLREARSAAAIKHENIVQVYSVEEEPLPYLVMEYVEGQTLKDKMDGAGPLEVAELLHLGRQMASGLAAAHAQGLIHRDIKPGNILIEAGGEEKVKITDFGLARAADDATITRTGVISGTPMFMAPEQAQGLALDHRADLFSLGSVFYQMASGRPPFRGPTALAVLKRVTEEPPRAIQEIIADVPEWLCAIIARLQAKKPEERFQSAKEVVELLGACQAQLQQGGTVELPADVRPFLPGTSSASNSAPQTVEIAAIQAATPKARAPRQRGWTGVAAACVLLALFAGLSATEVAGWTNFKGTIIRLFSPDGTLVIEVDDPGVSISIDGEELVIAGAGAKEIRLKPGQYKLLATKDGKVVRQELVTVTKNGRQIVRVSREDRTADSSDADKPGPAPASLNADADRRVAEWVLSIGGTVQVNMGSHIKDAANLPKSPFTLTEVFLLGNKKVTDADLVRFKDLHGLKRLQLFATDVSDAGLVHLKDLKWLKLLYLNHTKVTDKGMVHLTNLKGLEQIYLGGSRVSEGAVNKLSKALPGCQISWNGGVLEPTQASADPDRRAADWVLSIGGSVRGASEPGRLIKASDQIPRSNWKLIMANVTGNPRATDAELAAFEKCQNLTALYLSETPVTDAGLAYFKDSKNLLTLELAHTAVTDKGLAVFKDHKRLEQLNLIGTRVTDKGLVELGQRDAYRLLLAETSVGDEGVAVFKDSQKLITLDLRKTRVTEAGLANFRGCRNLTHLHLSDLSIGDSGVALFKDCKSLSNLMLNGTKVSDGGLDQIAKLKSLGVVALKQTKVTAPGVKKLAAARPDLRIEWDGGIIEPGKEQSAPK